MISCELESVFEVIIARINVSLMVLLVSYPNPSRSAPTLAFVAADEQHVAALGFVDRSSY